jgi:hypothetical protein
MVQVDAEMPRSGEPAARPFRCQAGCLESDANGQRCQPAGSIRFAVKMAPAWRGLPGRGGARAHDVAEFCASCWQTGLYPGLLYLSADSLDDSTVAARPSSPSSSSSSAAAAAAPAAAAAAAAAPQLAAALQPAAAVAAAAAPIDPSASEELLREATAEQKGLAIKIVREVMYEKVDDGAKKVAGKLRAAPSYVTGGKALRAEAQAFRERHPSAPQISLPPPAARALKARGEGPWTKKSMNDAMNTFMMDFDIMCVFPELTHFEELYEDARWRVSGFADQVRMPCAECGTNEFVRLNRSNVIKGDIKFMHAFDGPKALVCSRYTCSNPACCRTKDLRPKEMSVAQLKEQLQRRTLSCTGKKAELEARLQVALDEEVVAAAQRVVAHDSDDVVAVDETTDATIKVIIPTEFSASAAAQLDMLPDAVRLDFDFVLMPSKRGGYTHSLRSFLLNSCAKQMQDVATIAEQVRRHPPPLCVCVCLSLCLSLCFHLSVCISNTLVCCNQ